MSTIEKLKHDGAKRALANHIDSLMHELSHRNWGDIKDCDNFIRLGAAIEDARRILTQMEEALAALKEMDPDNR